MSLMIRGGTVVTADETKRADVYCEGGTIKAVRAKDWRRRLTPRSSMPAAPW